MRPWLWVNGSVLHCSATAVHVLPVPNVFQTEIAVCAAHQEQIAAGAEWRWDPDQNAILMGEDLKALGEDVVESLRVLKGTGVDSRFPDGFFRVEVRLRRGSGTEAEDRVLLMSLDQAAAWEHEFELSAGD
jgi:hypothetical protein